MNTCFCTPLQDLTGYSHIVTVHCSGLSWLPRTSCKDLFSAHTQHGSSQHIWLVRSMSRLYISFCFNSFKTSMCSSQLVSEIVQTTLYKNPQAPSWVEITAQKSIKAEILMRLSFLLMVPFMQQKHTENHAGCRGPCSPLASAEHPRTETSCLPSTASITLGIK